MILVCFYKVFIRWEKNHKTPDNNNNEYANVINSINALMHNVPNWSHTP